MTQYYNPPPPDILPDEDDLFGEEDNASEIIVERWIYGGNMDRCFVFYGLGDIDLPCFMVTKSLSGQMHYSSEENHHSIECLPVLAWIVQSAQILSLNRNFEFCWEVDLEVLQMCLPQQVPDGWRLVLRDCKN